MCSKLLHRGENHGWLYRVIEAGLRGLTTGYRALLRGALNVRTLVLLIGLAVAGSSYFLFSALKSELAPTEDQGFLVGIIQAPEGATIEYTDTYAKKLEEIFAKVPEAERYFVVSGRPTVSQGTTFLKLKPWGERKRTQQEIATAITPEMVAIPGVVAFPSSPPPLGQGVRDKPIQLVIETARPYDELQVMVDKMLDKAADNPGLVNVDTDLKLNAPQLEVDIDRDKAATVGVEVETLGRTLETLLGGRPGHALQARRRAIRRDRQGGRHRSPQSRRSAPHLCAWACDTMIPLSNLMSVKESVAPKELNHFNQLRSAMISSHLAPGYTLSEGLDSLEKAAKDVLPPTARIDYSGQSREFKQTSSSIYFTFVLALAFIYLVLAAQFESFKDPFIIMLTVSLSVTGALLALWWSGGTLNI